MRYSCYCCSSLKRNIFNNRYKLYVSVVTLSTQNNAKLLKQLRSGFKRAISCHKYQSKISTERQNQYLNYLIDPSFQGVNRLFILSFEYEAKKNKLQTILSSDCRNKNYNVMMDRTFIMNQ